MKIAAKLLYEMLRDRFELQDERLVNESLVLQRPLFYTGGRLRGSSLLCIAREPLTGMVQGQCCVIYAENCPADARSINYICLREDAMTVFNALQAIFDELDAWEERLNQALLDRSNVQELLNISYRYLGNPLIVMGTDFSPVAQAGEDQLPPEQRIFEPDAVSLELINALKQDELYAELQEAGGAQLYPAHVLGWRSWNVNIERGGRYTHRLVMAEGQRKLREGDGWLLEQLAQYVACLLERESAPFRDNSRLHAILTRILSDRAADDMEMSRMLARVGWLDEHEYCCLALRFADAGSEDSFSWLIRDHLKKYYPDSCSCLYRDVIVCYFNLSRLNRSLEDVSNELKYFIRECFLKAGYSRVMRGHTNLRRQYLQARAALEIGSQRNPYQWIHHFSGTSFEYLLERATSQMPAGMLCHERLLELREFDRLHGTEYMLTLRTFLDNSLNAMETARRLFIHRSTFLYRIEKIRDILESRLDDPEELLYLSLSFRLLEREEHRNDA